MKKIKSLLLTLAICIMCAMLTGCGAQKEEITAASNTFLQAMTDGDWDTVLSMCSEDMLEEMGMEMLQPGYIESYFYDGIGIDKDLLDAEAQTAVAEFVQNITDNMVQSYVINDVVVSKGEGTVSATITGYDENGANPFDDPALEEEVTALMEKYSEENMSELLKVYMTDGEEGMMMVMFNDLIPELLDLMSESLTNIETAETTLYFKVIKVDDKWMITNPINK